MIVFNCPKCGKEFKAKDQHAGRKFACSKCAHEMYVPTLQELQKPSANSTADSEPAFVPPTPMEFLETYTLTPEEIAEVLSAPTDTPVDAEPLPDPLDQVESPASVISAAVPAPTKSPPTLAPPKRPGNKKFFQRLKRDVSRALAVWEKQIREARSQSFGVLLIILGGIGVLRYMNMDTSVAVGDGRVNNIGLMQDRQNGLILSLAACVVGVVLSVVGVRKTGTATPTRTATANLSAADEIIKLKALMDQGVITPEEFATKKRQLIES